jgi:hypothetical protein
MTDTRSLETLTAEDFRQIQGTACELTVGLSEPGRQAKFRIEVANVTQSAGELSGSFRKPFAVLFHGPIEPVLPQGIYRLQHAQLGELELFIVPVGPDDPSGPEKQPTVMRYEAVFG